MTHQLVGAKEQAIIKSIAYECILPVLLTFLWIENIETGIVACSAFCKDNAEIKS